MISQIAIDDIEELQRQGLKPTVEDIIRLNALGCAVESANRRNPFNSLDYLPRVAAISPTVSFRQPTVGHEVWIDRVSRMAEKDYQTDIAIKAFALSRPVADLPDPDDPQSVRKAIETFAETFSDFTRDQIFAAIEYVIAGPSDRAFVYPLQFKSEDRIPDGNEDEDWKLCISVGLLNEGRVVLPGVNQAELESLTRQQLRDLIHRAYDLKGLDYTSDADVATENYYTTLDVITARLKSQPLNP